MKASTRPSSPLDARWHDRDAFDIRLEEPTMGYVEVCWGRDEEWSEASRDWGPRALLALAEGPEGLTGCGWLCGSSTTITRGPEIGRA